MKSVIRFAKLCTLGILLVTSAPFVFAQAAGDVEADIEQAGPETFQAQQNVTPDIEQSGPAKNTPIIRNPLKSDINTLPALIEAIIDLLLWIAVPVVVLIIIWVGFQFVLAQGNESKLTDAKRALWYALIGIAVLFGAKVIASIVENTVGSILR